MRFLSLFLCVNSLTRLQKERKKASEMGGTGGVKKEEVEQCGILPPLFVKAPPPPPHLFLLSPPTPFSAGTKKKISLCGEIKAARDTLLCPTTFISLGESVLRQEKRRGEGGHEALIEK